MKVVTDIILYRNTKIDMFNSFVIDNIQYYLKTFKDDNKLIFSDCKFTAEKIPNFSELFTFKSNEYLLSDLQKFNFAEVRDYEYEIIQEKEKGLKEIRYYFVSDISLVSTSNNNNLVIKKYNFTFAIDTLNTYLNKLSFAFDTTIRRRHLERFNFGDKNSNIYKTDKNLYLLRNIPSIKESLTCESIPSNDFSLMANNNNLDVAEDDFWVKITLAELDDNNKARPWTMFIPFSRDVKVTDVNGRTETITAKTRLGSDTLTALLTDTAKVVTISKSPYAPSYLLRNAYYMYNKGTIDISDDDRLKIYTLQLKYGDDYKLLTGILINAEDFFPRMDNNKRMKNPMCCIVDFVRKKKGLLNNVFGDYLICKKAIDDINKMIVNIHNKVSQDFFGESALYASCFHGINFLYEKISINLALESLTFNSDKLFSNLCDVYDFDPTIATTNFPDTTFLNISCTPYPYSDFGLNIDITSGDYFNISKDIHTSCHSDLSFNTFTNNYLNYLRSGQYNIAKKNIEDEYNKQWWAGFRQMGYGLANMGIGTAQIYFTGPVTETISTAVINTATNAIEGSAELSEVKKTSSNYSFFRYGAYHRIISGGWAAVSGLRQWGWAAKNEYNNNLLKLNSQRDAIMNQGTQINATGSSEDVYFEKAYINICKPTKNSALVLSRYFSRFGNAVNEIGIPTHNSRIFYDYLVCEAEFVKNDIDWDVIKDLKTRLSIGVTFIHKFDYVVEDEKGQKQNQYMYCFPDDYVENLEVTLYNYLTDYGK